MRAYLRLLIQNRVAAWNPLSHQRADQSKGRAMFSFAMYCVLALMLYGMLTGLEVALYNAFESIGEPETSLMLVALLCTALTLFTSFFYVLSLLFFNKDVQFISALPISSRGIMMAKLIMVTLSEAGIALLTCLPTVMLYGIRMSMGPVYYLKALLIVPLLPVIPLTITTLLSFLLIRISALWKRRESLTVIASFVFMAVFVWFEMKFTMRADADDITQLLAQLLLRQKSLLDMLAGVYAPARWMENALMLSGVTAWLNWLLFAAVSVGLIVLMPLLFGSSYQRLAIRQEETLARMNATTKRHGGSVKAQSQFKALYVREVKEIFTVPIYATNCLSSAVVFPILAVFMLINAGDNNALSAGVAMITGMVPPALFRAILAAIFMFVSSVNMASSTSVSREGKLYDFFTSLPITARTRLSAKFWMGMTFSVISMLPMTILACVLIPSLIGEILLAFAAALIFNVLFNAFSIERDANQPRLDWKTETEAIKQNTRAAITMFIFMALVPVLGAAFYGLTTLGISMDLAFVLICLLLILLGWLQLSHMLKRRYVIRQN